MFAVLMENIALQVLSLSENTVKDKVSIWRDWWSKVLVGYCFI